MGGGGVGVGVNPCVAHCNTQLVYRSSIYSTCTADNAHAAVDLSSAVSDIMLYSSELKITDTAVFYVNLIH